MSKIYVDDNDFIKAMVLAGRVAAVKDYIKSEEYAKPEVIAAMLGSKKENDDAGEQDGN